MKIKIDKEMKTRIVIQIDETGETLVSVSELHHIAGQSALCAIMIDTLKTCREIPDGLTPEKLIKIMSGKYPNSEIIDYRILKNY